MLPPIGVIAALIVSGLTGTSPMPASDGESGVRDPPRNFRLLERNPVGYGRMSPVARHLLLGDLLFHTPSILGPRAEEEGISCNTCHINGTTNARLFWRPLSDRLGNVDMSSGYFNANADDGEYNPINIPSLRGVRYSGRYAFDGRFAELSQFIGHVVSDEFGAGTLPAEWLDALTEYVTAQDLLPNPHLDRFGRVRLPAKSVVLDGEKLFAKPFSGLGGLSCSSCHEPASLFQDGKVHRRPMSHTASANSFDDLAKTPTLLNSNETAPYFHDGSHATLGDVVTWYDETWGLKLSQAEKSNLTKYLQTVGASDEHAQENLGTILVARAAYLSLLTDGPGSDDPVLWSIALRAVSRNLLSCKSPISIKVRRDEIVAALERIRSSVTSGTPPAHLRRDVSDLEGKIKALAGDWAGEEDAGHEDAETTCSSAEPSTLSLVGDDP